MTAERKLRLLFLAPLNSIHARRWVQYFADEGHEVHVVSFEKLTGELRGVQVHVWETPQNLIGIAFHLYPLFIKLRILIKGVRPDIIHVHRIQPSHWLMLLGLRCPIVITPWGSDILIQPKHSLMTRWAIKQLIKNSRAFICDAEHLKRELVVYGAPEKNIHIIFFGTNTRDFNPSKKNKEIRQRWNLDQDAQLVGSFRELKPIYDIPTFIRAAVLVSSEQPQARFLVCSDGPEKQNLMALAKELGINDKVIFTGRLSDQDLQMFMASIDVYVSASLSDGGLAASTAEAMASQVPVVISDFGDNKKWVEEGVSGFLFPLKDATTLAEKIVHLLANPVQAQQMAAKGREVIAMRNSYHVEMNKVSLIYQNLIKH
ncbi:MAG: glycosyltransferase family 4 protein [Candidatus Omnitrophica bacterium]|nr:glycosyltransferase family 4 protein [Candidatus Omnitrophota bacterium]